MTLTRIIPKGLGPRLATWSVMDTQTQESTKTMTATGELVFESFFDADSGVWSLRRVATETSDQDRS